MQFWQSMLTAMLTALLIRLCDALDVGVPLAVFVVVGVGLILLFCGMCAIGRRIGWIMGEPV